MSQEPAPLGAARRYGNARRLGRGLDSGGGAGLREHWGTLPSLPSPSSHEAEAGYLIPSSWFKADLHPVPARYPGRGFLWDTSTLGQELSLGLQEVA